jgi:hypothetical protein
MFDFLVALLLCTAAGDSIFCDGFGDFMYISTDRPENLVWAIYSTPSHDAAFVTSSTYLNDGKVAVPCRMTWDTGAQITSDYVRLTSTATMTIPANGTFVGALFLPNTPYALPVGVVVYIDVDNGLGTQIQVQTEVVQLNNGGRASIGIIPASSFVGADFHVASVHVYIYNSDGSGTWASPGETFDVGEVWFGTLQEFKALTDPKYDLIDPTLMRRSHSNQPWPLFVKPYRQWTYNFAPMDTATAFDSSSVPSFDTVRYEISQQNCALFLTRIYVQGTSTLDPVAFYQQMCFGKPDSIGALSAVKEGMGIWSATAKIGEAPP